MGNPNIGAHTDYDCNASAACLTLNSGAERDVDKALFFSSVEDSAKHEVMHLLLAKLSWKASARVIGEGELEEAEHGIVMRLMKIL